MKKLKIIYTGGTIGGKVNSTGSVIDEDVKRDKFIKLLFKKYPNIETDFKNTNIELSSDCPLKKFSENMMPSDWVQIAKSVFKAVEEGTDAIVIAHGTDTMSYTAAALSFILQGVKVPVILTGSNYPLEMPKTDATRNLHDAIRVALDDRFRGIYISFSGDESKPSDIHLGCRVRKTQFYDNCFKSIKDEIIGRFEKSFFTTTSSIKIINSNLLNMVNELNNSKKFELKDNIVDKVLFLKIYPGFNPAVINYFIEKKETKGIILELYNSGTGNVDGKLSLLGSITKAISNNIPIFATSQHEGIVTMDTYSSSREMCDAGVKPLRDMISEVAIPKLMWALGQTSSQQEVTDLMLKNICGEISN